jgi:predicted Holliday junction resolvase-like endonuclease
MEPLAAGLVLALSALIWVAARHLAYRRVYRYDDIDLDEARADAAKRSRSVRGGKVYEHIAPILPEFADRFDPADARFLGDPIDYVIFDGLGEGRLRRVVLVEVKTGGSRLNANERQVRATIERGEVEYELFRLR